MSLLNNEQSQNPSIKVLIADDDTPTRLMLRAAITQWGFDVIEAGDGEQAFHILQNPDSPQILIIDWLMPKLDGIELCKKIRAEITAHPYIILLTQNTGTTNTLTGLEAGADEFLGKPFKMAELRSRLNVGARIQNYKLLCEKNILNKSEMDTLKQSISQLEAMSQHLDTNYDKTTLQKNLLEIIDSLKLIKK